MSNAMIGWVKRTLTKLTRHQTSQLIKRSQRGDREAFGQLYCQFVDQIYRYLYFKTYQHEAAAQDLTQSVFLKAWNHIGEFNMTGSFQAWLYQIARNSVIDFYRREKPKNQLSESLADDEATLEEKMDTLFIKEHIKKAITRLPSEQQELVILKFIEGATNKEISVILGKSEDAVRAQQHRALTQLRKILTTYVKD